MDPLGITIIAVVVLTWAGKALHEWSKARNARLADEQEHRQALERAEQRAQARLALVNKLEDVVAIAVADRAVATTIQEHLAKHPHVRVETDEVEEEDEPQARRRRRR